VETLSRLKVALGVAVSVALFAYLFWNVDLHALGEQLRHARWTWVLFAAVLTPLGLVARARRWRYLFAPGERPPSLVSGLMIGYMVNNILPLRAGELARVYVVARRWGHGFWTVLATTIVERVLDGLAVVLMLGILVLLVDVPPVLRWGAGVLLLINLAGVVILVSFALAPGPSRTAIRWVVRRWPRAQAPALRIFERFVRGLAGVRTPAHAIPLVLWTVVVWVIPATFAWSAMRAMNLALLWVAPWTVLAFVAVGVSIPSAPGYVGVFHAATTVALGLFGVPHAEALGYALVLHAAQFVPVTLVGWIALLREQVSLAAATHATPAPDEAAPVETR
jgi:uncharacterized protein (TIRG00374 family)